MGLRAVPEVAPTAIVYLRQSAKKEESISLELQETICLDYCARMGYQVALVLSEQQSGRKWKERKGFLDMLRRVEAGEATKVIVYRWSRLSRERYHQAMALHTIEQAGAVVESATEQFDTSTAAGEFGRDQMLGFAHFQSRLIGEQWRETHDRRIRNGLPHGGGPRWGYVYADKRYAIDPEQADDVRWAYRQYIAGRGFRWLAIELNRRGIRNARGKEWTETGIARTMDSGFAAGLVPIGVLKRDISWAPGAHEAILDEDTDTWETYRSARGLRRAERAPRSTSPRYPLSGLVRCGDCGAPMVACKGGTGQTGGTYQCHRWRSKGDVLCVTVSRARVEQQVLKWLAQYAGRLNELAEQAPIEKVHTRTAVDTAAREVGAIDKQLTNLTVQLAKGLVPESAFAAARDELLAERAEAQTRLDRARLAVAGPPPSHRMVVSLLDDWDILPVHDRREMLKTLVKRVVIHRQEKRYARARVEVIPVAEIETLCER